MRYRVSLFILFVFFLTFNHVKADSLYVQNRLLLSPVSSIDSKDSLNKPLLRNLCIGLGTLYSGSIFGLYHLWYKDYPQSSFHFFNDNAEWLQVDKVGHTTSAYYISMIGYETMSMTGMNNDKSALIGGSLGLVYMTTVETFDGFSAGWGASAGDVIANFTGTFSFISQQLIWKEQRIKFKWSYHPTKYAAYRPDILGKNHLQRALKDYNGHTYWLSANISSFIENKESFPKWLNVAAGYSATGMTGAFINAAEYNDIRIPQFDRYRKYYISLDVDLTRLRVKNKSTRLLIKALDFVKIPMPAIEFSKEGLKFHPLYF